MFGILMKQVGIFCCSLGVIAVITGCSSRQLSVSATDRVYVPPAKPGLEQGKSTEAKAESPGMSAVPGRPGLESGPAPSMSSPGPGELRPPGSEPFTDTGKSQIEEVRVAEATISPPGAASDLQQGQGPSGPAGTSSAGERAPLPPQAISPGGTSASAAELAMVPNIIGMAKAEAQAAVSAAHLAWGAESLQPHKTIPPGHVSGQEPEAGVRIAAGSRVNVVLSTGWPGFSLEDAFFDYDRFAIRNDAKPALEADATTLKSEDKLKVVIEGHCDERGTSAYNLVLGEKRARAAKQYLQDLGVDPARIQITSLGKEKPFCTEHNPTCWQKNRRAHFVLP